MKISLCTAASMIAMVGYVEGASLRALQDTKKCYKPGSSVTYWHRADLAVTDFSTCTDKPCDAGDYISGIYPFYDSENKVEVAHDNFNCPWISDDKLICTFTVSMTDGSGALSFQGLSDGYPSYFGITTGTGCYVGAQGYIIAENDDIRKVVFTGGKETYDCSDMTTKEKCKAAMGDGKRSCKWDPTDKMCIDKA